MDARQLATALATLSKAVHDVEAILVDIRAERDPLALHIYLARREYRNLRDTKSGKRHAMSARLTWQRACELGLPSGLSEWERLSQAAPRR
jgi:hypothetical protein